MGQEGTEQKIAGRQRNHRQRDRQTPNKRGKNPMTEAAMRKQSKQRPLTPGRPGRPRRSAAQEGFTEAQGPEGCAGTVCKASAEPGAAGASRRLGRGRHRPPASARSDRRSFPCGTGNRGAGPRPGGRPGPAESLRIEPLSPCRIMPAPRRRVMPRPPAPPAARGPQVSSEPPENLNSGTHRTACCRATAGPNPPGGARTPHARRAKPFGGELPILSTPFKRNVCLLLSLEIKSVVKIGAKFKVKSGLGSFRTAGPARGGLGTAGVFHTLSFRTAAIGANGVPQ
jgi:hypothetical protein